MSASAIVFPCFVIFVLPSTLTVTSPFEVVVDLRSFRFDPIARFDVRERECLRSPADDRVRIDVHGDVAVRTW